MQSGCNGRSALVTGAASGIGRAIARRLVQAGAGVLLTDVDGEAAGATAEEIVGSGPGRTAAAELDVTDPVAWKRCLTRARRRFGYPSMLVNNAGAIGMNGLSGLSESEWGRVVDVCQRGTWLGMQAAAQSIQLAGGGAIVNMSSVFGLVGSDASFAYHAAKGAIITMTKAAAIELAARKVRVNALCPGLVATPMTAPLDPAWVDRMVSATPLGRMAEPEEIADAAVFLLSDRATYLTGSVLTVDGGYTAA